MAEVIKLVRGDNRPYIVLTLTDEATGAALNVATATVVVHFRAVGSSTVLATLPCSNVTTGTDGKVQFNFPGAALDVPAGSYEGEIEITYGDATVQTVYTPLRFRVREQFA